MFFPKLFVRQIFILFYEEKSIFLFKIGKAKSVFKLIP